MLTLRPYQQQAVDSALEALKSPDCKTLIVAPTGSGKSLIIAEICKRLPTKTILILQHRKELIQQNVQELRNLGISDIGVWSAGLNEKRIRRITYAGIQSIYKHKNLPKIDLVIIDEAHLLPPEGDGMYRTLLTHLTGYRLLGLTATPFRSKSGILTADTPKNPALFKSICYKIPIAQMVDEGFLVPVVGKASVKSIDTAGIRMVKGEFDLNRAAEMFDVEKSKQVISEIQAFAHNRESILIFSPSVAHANFFTQLLREYGYNAECITAETMFREEYIRRFKNKQIRFLVNVDVLTTGFNAPNADCIVMLRPTTSPGLYVQIVGRGMRTAENKTDCLILDFAGNIERFGPVDLVEIRKRFKKVDGKLVETEELEKSQGKTCPRCRTVVGLRVLECPDCQYLWPQPVKHDNEATDLSPMSAGKFSVPKHHDWDIVETKYSIGKKKENPPYLKITYMTDNNFHFNEFLFFDGGDYALRKSREAWIRHRNDQSLPIDTEEAFYFAERGCLKNVVRIRTVHEKGFNRVCAWKYGEKKRLQDDDREFLDGIGI